MSTLKFYNLPYHYCSCRNEYNQPTPIARNFKTFYDKLKKGKTGIQALKEMGITRMCCRKRYLVLPAVPMIDRNKSRYYDDTGSSQIICEDTRILKPRKTPPDFPLLPN